METNNIVETPIDETLPPTGDQTAPPASGEPIATTNDTGNGDPPPDQV